ncbi:hypothetical protein, partial [Inquilinus sp. CA228]|uniref:hypothetical protein n=1 Tax=Inquilinus sp. CA228 TaxID=3455609 RepID=UPI003F8D277D
MSRSFPENFGAINNNNYVKMAEHPTFFDLSFEDSFSDADGKFPEFVEWLQKLSSPIPPSDDDLVERLSPIAVTDKQHASLAACLASLISRSPSFRSRIRWMTEYVRDRLEIADGGFLGERGYDSSYGCGRNRAVAGWPRSQRRPSAIR